jgi:hypothetical protein
VIYNYQVPAVVNFLPSENTGGLTSLIWLGKEEAGWWPWQWDWRLGFVQIQLAGSYDVLCFHKLL